MDGIFEGRVRERVAGVSGVVDEAVRIVEAAFGSLAALVVNGKDPITAAITVKNNTRPSGSVFVCFVLGSYDPDTKMFTCLGVTVEGVEYIIGSGQGVNLDSPPSQKVVSIPSYAVNVSAQATFDVLCFVTPPTPAGMQWLFGDFGQGSRTYGIQKSSFETVIGTAIAEAVFTGIITINPSPEVPSVEIPAISIARS
jgi:hypothetical protein